MDSVNEKYFFFAQCFTIIWIDKKKGGIEKKGQGVQN